MQNAQLLTFASCVITANLWRGQVGAVVVIHPTRQAFEVEFNDRDGRTYESLGLRPDQIMVLRFEPAPHLQVPEAEAALA
jgi:Domain of unknown function (DUF4926)